MILLTQMNHPMLYYHRLGGTANIVRSDSDLLSLLLMHSNFHKILTSPRNNSSAADLFDLYPYRII